MKRPTPAPLPSRRPSGTPSGGQFAAGQHDEATVELAAPPIAQRTWEEALAMAREWNVRADNAGTIDHLEAEIDVRTRRITWYVDGEVGPGPGGSPPLQEYRENGTLLRTVHWEQDDRLEVTSEYGMTGEVSTSWRFDGVPVESPPADDSTTLPHPDPATEAAMGATALDGLRAIRRRIDEPEEYRAADIAADIYTLLGDLGMRV